MQPINVLLTLSSVNVLLVTLERFSFTTRIVLQPYDYLRLHELVQMTTLILFSVLIPVFLLRQVSQNFEHLRTTKGMRYLVMFVIGIYFYATGNGLHEVTSFLFNHYCGADELRSPLCGSLFFNDYYTGNILFFIGGYFMNLSLILLERMRPVNTFSAKDMVVLVANAVIYSLAIFAYAAFDRVLVGVAFEVITMLTIVFMLYTSGRKYRTLPFTLYCVISYTTATVLTVITRLIR